MNIISLSVLSFVLFASLNIQAESVNEKLLFRTAVVQQNAYDLELSQSLVSPDSMKQASALLALHKIVTNDSVKKLVENNDRIQTENLKLFCNALAAQSNISVDQTGESFIEPLRLRAVELTRFLAENTEVTNEIRANCFSAMAQLSNKTERANVEAVLLGLGIENFYPSELEVVLLGVYNHRLNSFDPANPTDRYWMSAEFATKVRGMNLHKAQNSDLREAYARVAYLANDEQVLADYKILLQDTDAKVRFLATTLVNFVNKTDFSGLIFALNDSNDQVVVAAIEQLKTLKQNEFLLQNHLELLGHASPQVRRSMLSAVESGLAFAAVEGLLEDSSLAVRQLATAIAIRLSAGHVEKRSSLIAAILSSNDLAKKRGLVDAWASLNSESTERKDIFQQLISDQNPFVVSYAMDAIADNKLVEVYPAAIEKLGAPNQEVRLPATQVVLNWTDYPERLNVLAQVYAASLDSIFVYLRSEIINQLAPNKEATVEIALLKTFLAQESDWRQFNKIAKKLNELEGTELELKSPTWQSSEGENYLVEEARPQIEMITTKGKMVFELYNDLTPIHVSLILWAIDQGHLNRNFFHRVIDNFVAQAYRPIDLTSQKSGDARGEIVGLKQVRGTIAMPRSDYLHSGDAGGFYINLVTNFSLDHNYTTFGMLIEGDSVLSKLEIGDSVLSVKRIK